MYERIQSKLTRLLHQSLFWPPVLSADFSGDRIQNLNITLLVDIQQCANVSINLW